jgi:ketosteroid isomerase-like protein
MTTNNYLVNIAENYLETAVHKSADDLVALVGSEGLVADPRFGICSGEPKLKEFTTSFQGWLKAFSPKVQHLRTTATEKRVCSEDILSVNLGHEKWELAVGAVVCNQESGSGAKVHVYYTNWPFNNHSHSLRPALFDKPEPGMKHTGVIQRYFESLTTGDLEKLRTCFEADIYFREPSGPPYTHWGTNAVIEYFKGLFSSGAPMLREDTVTDDGRCAIMEFTVFGWNGKVWEDPAAHHAGLACYERSRDELMRAIRIYDDVDFTPGSSVTSG